MAGAIDDEDALPSLAPQWLKEGGALGAGSASRIVKSSPAAEEPPLAGRQGACPGRLLQQVLLQFLQSLADAHGVVP